MNHDWNYQKCTLVTAFVTSMPTYDTVRIFSVILSQRCEDCVGCHILKQTIRDEKICGSQHRT